MSFTKGQLVTFLQNWDSKGTVRINDLIVYSCGRKQMVLVNAAGEKFQGRFFSPTEEQAGCSRVVSRLSPELAQAAALALGAEIVNARRVAIAAWIAHYAGNEGYKKAMQEDLAALHEPRVMIVA